MNFAFTLGVSKEVRADEFVDELEVSKCVDKLEVSK